MVIHSPCANKLDEEILELAEILDWRGNRRHRYVKFCALRQPTETR